MKDFSEDFTELLNGLRAIKAKYVGCECTKRTAFSLEYEYARLFHVLNLDLQVSVDPVLDEGRMVIEPVRFIDNLILIGISKYFDE